MIELKKYCDSTPYEEKAMQWKDELKWLIGFAAAFFVFYFLPIGTPRFDGAILESFALTKWYTQEHVLLCLVPALFIAGAMSAFIRQSSVMKYFGCHANKVLAYGVASVSGVILAVCSCTVLPLFAGIYKRGAGLGPAIAFLYSGPAINVLAIVLTARILGIEMGIARAIGAILFSVVIGLAMHYIFRSDETNNPASIVSTTDKEIDRPLWQTALLFGSMCAILIFANWGKSQETSGFFYDVYTLKWALTSLSAIVLAIILVLWFGAHKTRLGIASFVTFFLSLFFHDTPEIPFFSGFAGLSWAISGKEGELGTWLSSSWELAKQIVPLLFVGVLVSGFLLGSPGHEGILPSSWVLWAVGGNSFTSNFASSVIGAFMYFATLTEVPILQGLMGSGMGKGPALALLLAGPALSLPSMLVLKSIMGTKKTATYVALVVGMSTVTGMIYGSFF